MAARQRVASLDIIRGAVMVLMAIDHVRVYSGVPAGGPTPGIFFTRWITHFCAPAFVFFAGTAAFLHGRKLGDPSTSSGSSRAASRDDTVPLARYLVTRGLVLVLLELTVIRAAWTFNVDYSQFILAGVIWMLGWCMILLAGLIWLPTWAIGAFGLLVMLLQNVFGLPGRALPEPWRWLWEFVYPVGAEVRLGQDGPAITVLYTIVPWIGVMAAGYAFGAIVTREPAERRRLCLRIGLSATALSRHGARRLADPGRERPCGVVRYRPVRVDPSGTEMETSPALPGVRHRRRDAVRAVPVVRGRQGAAPDWMAAIHVGIP